MIKKKTLEEQVHGLRCAVEYMATSLYGNPLSERTVMKILEYTDASKKELVKNTEPVRRKK